MTQQNELSLLHESDYSKLRLLLLFRFPSQEEGACGHTLITILEFYPSLLLISFNMLNIILLVNIRYDNFLEYSKVTIT